MPRTIQPILLVEDSLHDAELALAAMEKTKLPNEIVLARDGEEALNYLHRRGKYQTRPCVRPLVVLLDLKMPKVDGFEVLRAIRSDPALRTIPVVILTSSREESDLARCYEMGANSYVVKPVEFQAFADALGQIGKFWATLNEAPPNPA